jgi:hypothetical protein
LHVGRENQSLVLGNITDALFVEDEEDIYADSSYVEYVFEN